MPSTIHLSGSFPDDFDREPVQLSYEGGNHYNSIVPAGDGSGTWPGIEPLWQGQVTDIIRKWRSGGEMLKPKGQVCPWSRSKRSAAKCRVLAAPVEQVK